MYSGIEIITASLITVKIAGIATLVSLLVAIFLIWVINNCRASSVAKIILEVLIYLPLVLPPTVMGFYLLLLLSRQSFVGKLLLEVSNTEVIFTPTAAVIAAATAALPIIYKTIASFLESVEAKVLDAAKIDGASGQEIFWFIQLPLAFKGIMVGLFLAFLRACGEFGATLMVAGNIPGKTQTLSLAIWSSVVNGQYGQANLMAALLALVSLMVIVIMRFVNGKVPF